MCSYLTQFVSALTLYDLDCTDHALSSLMSLYCSDSDIHMWETDHLDYLSVWPSCVIRCIIQHICSVTYSPGLALSQAIQLKGWPTKWKPLQSQMFAQVFCYFGCQVQELATQFLHLQSHFLGQVKPMKLFI